MPYADYMTSRVLGPLGLTSTGFAPPPDRLAAGYVLDGAQLKHPPMLKTGAYPAGGLFSSVRDLARYAAFQLSAWPPRDEADNGPLRRSSVREAQRMSTWDSLTVSRRAAGKAESYVTASGYGFGWVAYDTCDWDNFIWHNGALTDGYRSMVLLLPDRGVGIVALTNLFDEQAGLEAAVHDGMHVLEESGALAKRVWPSTPALLAVRDAVVALSNQWDDALAARIYPEGVTYLADVKRDLAEGLRDHGACHVVSTRADASSRLRWQTSCDRGGESWSVTLNEKDGRIVSLRGEDHYPPEPRLAAAASRVAQLLGRWNDRVYDTLIALPAERPKVKASFAEAAAGHGSCRVDHAYDDGDKTHARFVLSCSRGGPLDLRAVLDDKTGKVTEVTLGEPTDAGKKCP